MSSLVTSTSHRFAVLPSCIAAFYCGAASAALVTYPDLPTYLSASGPVSMESFEQVGPIAMGIHPPLDLGSFTVWSDWRYGILATGPSSGQKPTDGSQYLAFMAQTLRFTFVESITALALDFVDYGDLSEDLMGTLSMTTSVGDSFIIKEPGPYPGNGNVFFFGFRSDIPLNEVTFHLTRGDIENVAVDAVRYASVPEPSAIGFGLCGVVWTMTRRCRRAED